VGGGEDHDLDMSISYGYEVVRKGVYRKIKSERRDGREEDAVHGDDEERSRGYHGGDKEAPEEV
jgi:hypothetical protein